MSPPLSLRAEEKIVGLNSASARTRRVKCILKERFSPPPVIEYIEICHSMAASRSSIK
ncbi:Hypothetical protein FKW44_025171 [Caligus rogercresseyi]|uniref:Uncharacterized protein n=1 Tax=Caligus rogercresseyi TaxID=217165 RepID=A0A7T8JSB9_CALRO|nr:Hypothetical protein FKW44_025171 [Caligus rogercresseyi]